MAAGEVVEGNPWILGRDEMDVGQQQEDGQA
jgi:hypothetical protein